MKIAEVERLLAKQLRVRKPLPLRELAARAGLERNGCTSAMHNLVRHGLAERHAGSTARGDREARYSKPSNSR